MRDKNEVYRALNLVGDVLAERAKYHRKQIDEPVLLYGWDMEKHMKYHMSNLSDMVTALDVIQFEKMRISPD